MSTLGNIIWFIIGGWWNFLVYSFLGILFSITIIGIPIGKALFQYAKLMVFPFGKVIIKETELKGKENVSAIRRVGGVIANLIWLPIGIVMFIGNILAAVGMAVTIIGIPVAIVLVRSAKFLIWPVGAKVVTKEEAEAVRMERSMMKVMGTAMAVNQSMMQQPVQAQQSMQSQPQSMTQTQQTFQSQPGQNSVSPVLSASQSSQQAGYSGTAGSQTGDTRSAGTQFGVAEQSEMGLTLESFVEKSEQVVNGLREKLLQNQVVNKLLPYLDYLALGLLVLNVITSFISGPIVWMIVLFLLWLLVVAAEGLEIIKGNRLMVLILLSTRLILRLIGLAGTWYTFRNYRYYGRAGVGVFTLILTILFLLIHIAVLVWYILVFVKGKEPVVVFTTSSGAQNPSAGGNAGNSSSSWGTGTTSGTWTSGAGTSSTAWTSGTGTSAGGTGSQTGTAAPNAAPGTSGGTQAAPMGRRFCSQCGAEYTGGARFCPKCGAKTPE